MTLLRWISTFSLGASIVGALFLIFDVSFIDHKWSYNLVITCALISIASSGLYFIVHTEERSK
jgi:hypothetical protein